MRKFIALLPALGLLGCASQPEDIATVYVSPIQYQNFSCSQIATEIQRVTRRASELEGTLQETADNDAGQMGVGLLLFWPTLFFLEGGDGPQAQEYARLKGERDALEQSAIQKNCGDSSEQVAAVGTLDGAVPPRSGSSEAGAIIVDDAKTTNAAASTLAAPSSTEPGGVAVTTGKYGAIALGKTSRFNSGQCIDQDTAELAEACAIRECGRFCELQVVFESGQCAAIVGHPGVTEVAVGASSSEAVDTARSQCRQHPRRGRTYSNCQVLVQPSCNL